MRNGVKSILRLRFANGQELRCTPNHRLWTLNRGYVAAEDLTADDSVLLNDSPTPAEDASWALPVKVEALAKSFSRGGTVTYQELPDTWTEGLGELTGHLIGDGWMTEVQTAWVYGGDDIEDGVADSHEGMLRGSSSAASPRQEMDKGRVQLRRGKRSRARLLPGTWRHFGESSRKARPEGNLHRASGGAGSFPAWPFRCGWVRVAVRRRQGVTLRRTRQHKSGAVEGRTAPAQRLWHPWADLPDHQAQRRVAELHA